MSRHKFTSSAGAIKGCQMHCAPGSDKRQRESLFGGWERACWGGAGADSTLLHRKTRAEHPGVSVPAAWMHACRRAMQLHCSCEMQVCGRGAGGDGAWSGTTPGRGQPSTGSKSRMCLGLEHRLETGNAVLGSPGILPCNPPALARLLGAHPEHPAPCTTVPREPRRGKSEGSDWETPHRAGERKGISHRRFIRASRA